MISEKNKTQLYIGWAFVSLVAALVFGVTSVTTWMVVASVAIVPPLVARSFWHAPEPTTSERIRNARR
jgi:hypothetical protein